MPTMFQVVYHIARKNTLYGEQTSEKRCVTLADPYVHVHVVHVSAKKHGFLCALLAVLGSRGIKLQIILL